MPKTRDLKRIDLPYQPISALVGATTVVSGGIPTDPTITDFTDAQHSHQNAAGGGKLDHGLALLGLTDDDHTQYALLAGRATGQHLNGGTAASENIFLSSTAHATKGKLFIGSSAYDEANNRLGIGTSAPLTMLHVGATLDTLATAGVALNVQNSGTTSLAVRNALADSEGFLMCDASDVVMGSATNDDLIFRTNNINQMTIDQSGSAVTIHNASLLMTTGDVNFNSTVAPGVRWDMGGGVSAAIRKNGSLLTLRVPTAGFSIQNNAGTSQSILVDDSGNLFIKRGYLLMGDQSTALYNGWGATANVISVKSSTVSVLELAGNRTSGATSVGTISFQNLAPGSSDDRVAQIQANRGTTNDSADLQFVTWNAGAVVVPMTMKQDGKVGIGTTGPGYTLDVAGTINALTNIYINGVPVATGTIYWSAATGGIQYSSGNVGIGTSSPTAYLHVSGAGTSKTFLKIDDTAANADTLIDLVGTGMGGGSYYVRGRTATTDEFWIKGGGAGYISTSLVVGSGAGAPVYVLDGGVSSRDLAYRTGGVNRWLVRVDSTAESGSNVGSNFLIAARQDDGSANFNAIYIQRNNGNVGVRNSAPTARLHVGAGLDASGVAGTHTLMVSEAGVTWLSVRNSLADIEQIMYVDATQGVLGMFTAHPLAIRTGNTNAIYIDTSQNVGLGNNAPGAALDVSGNAYVRGDSTNATYTSPGNLAIKNAASTPFMSLHDNAGARLGFVQGTTTGFNVAAGTGIPLRLFSNNAEQARFDTSGNFGISTTTPQGLLHGHNGTGGFLFVTKTAVGSTAVTLIPDGTGDVVRGLNFLALVRASSGGVQAPYTAGSAITPGSSFNIYINGSDICALSVSAAGAVTVARTGGTLTYDVALWLIWQ